LFSSIKRSALTDNGVVSDSNVARIVDPSHHVQCRTTTNLHAKKSIEKTSNMMERNKPNTPPQKASYKLEINGGESALNFGWK
jgi:hypothetical protein